MTKSQKSERPPIIKEDEGEKYPDYSSTGPGRHEQPKW